MVLEAASENSLPGTIEGRCDRITRARFNLLAIEFEGKGIRGLAHDDSSG
jgi:hypothetical protein